LLQCGCCAHLTTLLAVHARALPPNLASVPASPSFGGGREADQHSTVSQHGPYAGALAVVLVCFPWLLALAVVLV